MHKGIPNDRQETAISIQSVGDSSTHGQSGWLSDTVATASPWIVVVSLTKEESRPGGHRTALSATAGSRPVPSLNFGEIGEAAPSSLTSHQAVRHAARLVMILLDKILSTIESNY
jgi:hypothetical protein